MQHLYLAVVAAVSTHAHFTAENYVVMTTEYLLTLYITIYLYFFQIT